MPVETPRNVAYFTPEERAKYYPRMGKYTRDELLDASFVKAKLESGDVPPNVEFMWIKVDRVNEKTVEGKIDNLAVYVGYQIGDKIEVSYDQIAQIMSESKKNWFQCSLCTDRFDMNDPSLHSRLKAHEEQKHNPLKKRASSNTRTGKVYWRLEQD